MKRLLVGLLSLLVLIGCSGSSDEWSLERAEFLEDIEVLEEKLLDLEEEKKALETDLESFETDGVEVSDWKEDINGIQYSPYYRHYHFVNSFEEYMYVIYRGKDRNKSILQLRQIDPYGSSKIIYEAIDRDLDFRINPLDGSLVIESGDNLIFFDSQGALVKEYIKGDFEIASEEGIRLLDFQENSHIIWLTSQETYVIKNYITINTQTEDVNKYSYELRPSEDYDLDLTSGWMITSDYPVFLDVETRDAYLSGNAWTNLYLYNVFTSDKYLVDIGRTNVFEPNWTFGTSFEYKINNRYYRSNIQGIIEKSGLDDSVMTLKENGIQLYTEGDLHLEDGIIINLEKYDSNDFITWHRVWNHIPVGTLSTHSHPTLDDDVIYIVIDQTLYAIDYETGETIWQVEGVGASATDQPPLIDNQGTIYLSGQFEPNLTAIQDGQILWQISNDDLYGIQTLELKENQLIVHLDHVTVFAYDKSGKRIVE